MSCCVVIPSAITNPALSIAATATVTGPVRLGAISTLRLAGRVMAAPSFGATWNVRCCVCEGSTVTLSDVGVIDRSPATSTSRIESPR